jgi:hypothetical protein
MKKVMLLILCPFLALGNPSNIIKSKNYHQLNKDKKEEESAFASPDFYHVYPPRETVQQFHGQTDFPSQKAVAIWVIISKQEATVEILKNILTHHSYFYNYQAKKQKNALKLYNKCMESLRENLTTEQLKNESYFNSCVTYFIITKKRIRGLNIYLHNNPEKSKLDAGTKRHEYFLKRENIRTLIDRSAWQEIGQLYEDEHKKPLQGLILYNDNAAKKYASERPRTHSSCNIL